MIVHRPATTAEAVAILEELGPAARPLAGATWTMRGWQRGERHADHYVALDGIDALRTVVLEEDAALLGAGLTHARLAAALTGIAPAAALAQAARLSAFPAVRNVATLGGNLFAEPFPEADLVPALLVCDAVAVLESGAGARELPIEQLLGERGRRDGELLTHVRVPLPPARRGAFVRQTVRAAGEYAVAALALSVDRAADGTIAAARVAFGSIEERSRRIASAEQALAGRPLDEAAAADAARAAAGELRPRDGLDAPGWYRLELVPHMLREAVAAVAEEA